MLLYHGIVITATCFFCSYGKHTYKDGTKTLNFNDMECALSQRASIPGSDLEI